MLVALDNLLATLGVDEFPIGNVECVEDHVTTKGNLSWWRCLKSSVICSAKAIGSGLQDCMDVIVSDGAWVQALSPPGDCQQW